MAKDQSQNQGNCQSTPLSVQWSHCRLPEKTSILKELFFPPPPAADLGDIDETFTPVPGSQACPMEITRQEVLQPISYLKADKAPGADRTPDRILKAWAEKLSNTLAPLYHACVNLVYHIHALKTTNALFLKKSRKS